MEEKMIAKINMEIKAAKDFMKTELWNAMSKEEQKHYFYDENEKIKAMISMLEIVTGKIYTYNTNFGVYEYSPI